MKYFTQKDTALTAIDTHAGAGLYRFDGDYTESSSEAKYGVFKLVSASNQPPAQAKRAGAATKSIAPTSSSPSPVGITKIRSNCQNDC